jgi:UDP:flavonoid glycosyltransferase YjiC (YdhE family)
VLFSLGTNVRSDTLGEERISMILKALTRLDKYKFLWKFETKEKLPIALPKNVRIQAWMPQNDILAHPNTKLFISHCGLLSTQESLWYGVPVLGFPVFADQPQNALRLKEQEVSETMSILDFTEEELYETIKKLIEDPKYIKNAKKISKAVRDKPMTALEQATYWTEWVIRNPNIDLEGAAADLNLFQRHSFDVYTVFLLFELLVLYVLYKILTFLYRLIFSSKSKVKVGSDKKRN